MTRLALIPNFEPQAPGRTQSETRPTHLAYFQFLELTSGSLEEASVTQHSEPRACLARATTTPHLAISHVASAVTRSNNSKFCTLGPCRHFLQFPWIPASIFDAEKLQVSGKRLGREEARSRTQDQWPDPTRNPDLTPFPHSIAFVCMGNKRPSPRYRKRQVDTVDLA